MITQVEGVRVGHWSGAGTGCTAILLPAGTVASGEVRGGAPGTREWALLDPRRTVDRVNAVVLAGRSAFGLGACDGVARWCEERGIGWPTSAGPVPIVVGMVVYDLGSGDPSVRPGPDEGYAACRAARAGAEAEVRGPVGAGAGVTVAKWKGAEFARPGGLGSAAETYGGVTVAALVAVNAIGDLVDGSGPRVFDPARSQVSTGEATTIGVVVTNAQLDKTGCRLAAEAAHDGLARVLDPVHTAVDGDAFVAAATGAVAGSATVVRSLAAWVVGRAVEDALTNRS
jgi:L-aminopeptidase/D-esterase-like protein